MSDFNGIFQLTGEQVALLRAIEQGHSGAAIAALVTAAAGQTIEVIPFSQVQKAVACLKAGSLGMAAVNAVQAAEDATVMVDGSPVPLTSQQKFDLVLSTVAPLIASKVDGVADVDSIARQVVQSVHDDTVSTSALEVASAVIASADQDAS